MIHSRLTGEIGVIVALVSNFSKERFLRVILFCGLPSLWLKANCFGYHCMMSPRIQKLVCALLLTAAVVNVGCQAVQPHPAPQPSSIGQTPVPRPTPVPHELCKVVLPTYVIEPPDVLMIDAIRVVPRSPYHLRTLDVISIHVQPSLPEAPIEGLYTVDLDGLVKLGPLYGSVKVAGLTVEQAEESITSFLRMILRDPVVTVALADTTAKQQIAGQHLVGPDGTVTLGSYGSVQVVGMTIVQARAAIEQYLQRYLEYPEISLDVYAYNSKVYYIVTQGAGLGDGVYRFPVTGNETVLDAISQINGLQQVSSKKLWIARPTDDPGKVQVLPVKWEEITAQASANTNYQLLPGDRLFIAEDKLIALDTGLAKLVAPMERVMGFSLLGVGTVTRFSGPVLKGGGNPQTNF
jgi:polysaccharide biosynthesis/export protein